MVLPALSVFRPNRFGWFIWYARAGRGLTNANGGIVKEIVGAMIGTIITNNPADIIRGLENNTVVRLLSKQEVQLMASFDLGRNWEALADSKVLFCLADDGKPFPASRPTKRAPDARKSAPKKVSSNKKGSVKPNKARCGL